MVFSPAGVGPSSKRKLQTCSLVREGAQHQQICNYLKTVKERKIKIGLGAPDECLTPRQTDRRL
jgi:hypothetical protein